MRKDANFHLQKQGQKIFICKNKGGFLNTAKKLNFWPNHNRLCYRFKREADFILLQISVFAALSSIAGRQIFFKFYAYFEN
jgi:hypothetical protein